ncbi:unnamed protein product [Urochloa decumbens]|uniref:DOMON domain-containing protein n=1 Tax=Urochloa decumbens TaxID=240449 RepID=A0ABC9EW13_9POAL
MASATPRNPRARAIAILAVLVTAAVAPTATRAAVAPSPAAAGGGCDGDKFPAGRSYAHCAALPYLGARLHWTHDAKTGSLSVAFVAKPPAGGGWVSWAINPAGEGMKGAQALVAFRPSPAAPYAVNTYNITGYKPFGASSTPIAFKATGLAADESAANAGGEVRLYGKLQLAPGTEVVNHIWQVGSTVTGGAPVKHAFDKDNLEAKGKLALSGAALAPAPEPAAAGAGGGSSAAKGGSGGSGGKPSAATATVSAPVLMMLLALAAGFMAIV